MVQKFEKDIVVYSLLTRIAYVFISSSFRLLVPRHEANVFSSPLAVSAISSIYDEAILFIFGGLTNWDAQHYYQIAQNGYMFEQSLAFFPLYPSSLCLLVKPLDLFFGEIINPYSKLILASFFLNSACFTFSSLVLFKLSKTVLRNNFIAFRAALLFCVSPSSIFFVASYTESLYSLLVFSGMYKYAKGCVFQSSLLFSLATSCRSNGLTNAGFVMHYILFRFMNVVEGNRILEIKLVFKFVRLLLKALICFCLVVSPYVLFQVYGYYVYCVNKRYIQIPVDLINFAVNEGFKMPSDNILWCNNSLPLPYSFVQSHYWNVGLFKYYQFKQVPNFLLAAPISLIIIPYSCVFLKCYRSLLYDIKYIYNPNVKFKVKLPTSFFEFLPRSTFVFTAHALVLTVFCLININVQVTTRILCSSSPLIYWLSALHFKKIFRDNKTEARNGVFNVICFGMEPIDKTGFSLCLYFFSYTLIGIVLFSCNYPWT